jgi:hypothetical protein
VTRFNPTLSQIEKIAELETARMPPALIAQRIGIDLAAFQAWTARLVAARDYVEPPESTADIMRWLSVRKIG